MNIIKYYFKLSQNLYMNEKKKLTNKKYFILSNFTYLLILINSNLNFINSILFRYKINILTGIQVKYAAEKYILKDIYSWII